MPFEESLSSLAGGPFGEDLEGCVGGLDGGVDVFFAAVRAGRPGLAGAGVDHVEAGVGFGGDGLAVDDAVELVELLVGELEGELWRTHDGVGVEGCS